MTDLGVDYSGLPDRPGRQRLYLPPHVGGSLPNSTV